MKNKYSFRVFWSDEDEGYIAISPEFPGLSAFGDTEEEALKEAKVALSLFIESMTEDGEALPKPRTAQEYSGQIRLRLPRTLHRLAAEMAEYDGVSLNQFLVDAVRAKVAGEEVGRRFLSEVLALIPKRAEAA